MIFDHNDDDDDVKKIEKTRLNECDRDKWIVNVNTKRKTSKKRRIDEI